MLGWHQGEVRTIHALSIYYSLFRFSTSSHFLTGMRYPSIIHYFILPLLLAYSLRCALQFAQRLFLVRILHHTVSYPPQHHYEGVVLLLLLVYSINLQLLPGRKYVDTLNTISMVQCLFGGEGLLNGTVVEENIRVCQKSHNGYTQMGTLLTHS